MRTERTLLLIKPDGVQRGLIGEVLRRLEARGFTFERIELKTVDESLLREHYAEHVDKPFFPRVVSYMTSGPILAAIVTGAQVASCVRAMSGATNPVDAAPGTIRGDLARDWGTDDIFNIVHSSDSPESAEREIAIWFA